MGDAVDELMRAVKRRESDFVDEVANDICIDLMRATEPYGTGKKARDLMENAIEREVDYVVVGVSPRFEQFIRQGGNVRGNDVRVSWAAKDGRVREAIFPLLDLEAGRPAVAAHHKRFRDGRGRVKSAYRNHAIVVPAALRKMYVEQKKDLAGFAKAGWIGNMVRSKYSVPRWIRRHSSAVPTVRRKGEENGACFVEVENPVRYATRLLRMSGTGKRLYKAHFGEGGKAMAAFRKDLEKLGRKFTEAA